LRPLGLKVDAATANVEVRKWLRTTLDQFDFEFAVGAPR